MSIPSSSLRTGEPGEPDGAGNTHRRAGRPGPRVRQDLEGCEALLSRAAKAGVALDEADVNAVRNARSAYDRREWSCAIGSAFYRAMSRIATAAQYPGARIVDDIAHCREMVSYGAQNGRLLDRADVQALSNARDAVQTRTWSPDIEAAFYAAMSRIAHGLRPVVAETAGEEARRGARRAIRLYTYGAVTLTIVVLALSCMLFVGNQISGDIANIVKANDAEALTLHNQLIAHRAAIDAAVDSGNDGGLVALQNSQPALQIKESLQNFATNNRQLFSDVSRISWATTALGFGAIRSPYKLPCPEDRSALSLRSAYFTGGSEDTHKAKEAGDWQCDAHVAREVLEITLPLLGKPDRRAGDAHPPTERDAVDQGFEKIAVYQDIRAMALYANDIILSVFGAVTGFLLPVLYAGLGACASILRQLKSDSSANTFHPEHSKVANRSHLTCAVIVGISIGLFSKLLEGGKDISPLALAFVAGYASDKFFYFVDRLVGAIFPPRETEPPPRTPPVIVPSAQEASSAPQRPA
jgi:hypothetical protein